MIVLALEEYDIESDIGLNKLPKFFLKLKTREYFKIGVIELRFISIPDRTDQRGGYNFRGRVEVTFTSYSLNNEELDLLRKLVEMDDLGDLFKVMEGVTEEGLEKIQLDIDEFLNEDNKNQEEKSENKKNKKEKDTNPFSALFSFFKFESNKSDALINTDSKYEQVIRSQAILESRKSCVKLWNGFKGSVQLATF